MRLNSPGTLVLTPETRGYYAKVSTGGYECPYCFSWVDWGENHDCLSFDYAYTPDLRVYYDGHRFYRFCPWCGKAVNT